MIDTPPPREPPPIGTLGEGRREAKDRGLPPPALDLKLTHDPTPGSLPYVPHRAFALLDAPEMAL